MERAAISDEDESVVNGRSGHDMPLQQIGPIQPGFGDVARFCSVDAFDERFVLAPENVASARSQAVGLWALR